MKKRTVAFIVIFSLVAAFCGCMAQKYPNSFSEEGFEYTYIGEKELSISCNYLNVDSEIVLPYTLPDREEIVTTVARKGFIKFNTMVLLFISEGYTTISNEAFAECTNLTAVSLPATLTSVRKNAFRDCFALSDVFIYAETPPKLIGEIFTIPESSAPDGEIVTGDISKEIDFVFRIHIPFGCYEAYAGAKIWSNYVSYFIEMPPLGIQP